LCNSHHNRIDHNLFDGKYDAGAWLIIDGSHGTVPDISKHDRIDHNIFRNNTPRVTNVKETIRIGVSDLSLLNSYTLVENNLFEDCDGDPEIVSVKSCSNIIRNNTFRRCLGTLSLRHGHNSIVSGNFFFGEGKTVQFNGSEIGCGGIRVYGMNHQIFNNYFEGLTGSKWDAAITITNGDVANNSTNLTSHFLPENVVFAHNTLINNASDIEIGFDNNGNYGRAPKNCRIINNLIINDKNPVVKAYSTASLSGVEFAGNLIHATGTASVGLAGFTSSQVMTVDPLLIKSKCRAYGDNCEYETAFELFKLTKHSPAINASVAYEFQQTDFEGQPVAGIRDIGADEFNPDAPVQNIPMSESTAGPMASELIIAEISTSLSLAYDNSSSISVFPNPIRQHGTLVFDNDIADGSICTVRFYNLAGVLVDTFTGVISNSRLQFNTKAKGMLMAHIQSNNNSKYIQVISE
jgi:hypothetical protein